MEQEERSRSRAAWRWPSASSRDTKVTQEVQGIEKQEFLTSDYDLEWPVLSPEMMIMMMMI